jgi:hypothetical protein
MGRLFRPTSPNDPAIAGLESNLLYVSAHGAPPSPAGCRPACAKKSSDFNAERTEAKAFPFFRTGLPSVATREVLLFLPITAIVAGGGRCTDDVFHQARDV